MNVNIERGVAKKKVTPHAFSRCEPLPSGFGEIGPDDEFDAERFFTAIRCNGWAPTVSRCNGEIWLGQRGNPFDLQRERSALQKDRYERLVAWAARGDRDEILRWKYIGGIVDGMPEGDFRLPLG